MRSHLPILVAIVLAASPAAAQDTTLAARIRRVENGLTTPVVLAGRTDQGAPIAARMRALNTPAVSIAVIDRGRLAWARAYGSLRADGAPADTGTLFQAASISKPVATLGALLLVEEGKLSLDADVNTFLRSWRVPENAFTATEKVTLRRLVSHSAGLTVHGFPGYAADAPVPTAVQVLDGQAPANTRPVRVDTVPGSLLRYSGGGLTVMQVMMEDVSGRPFAALLRETVLLPLGMAHSSFDYEVAPAAAARIARAHDAAGAPIVGGWHRYPEMAAAGLWTTPSDLARFLLGVRSAYAGEAGAVLSPALAREMLTLQKGADGSGYGLGLGLERMGTPAWSFGHGGANEGYRAQMIFFPETGQGAVVMTSSDAGSEVVGEVLRAVAREYGWPVFQPVEKTAGTMDPAAPRDLPGRYEMVLEGDTVTLEITTANGELALMAPGWPAPRVMYPLSTGELRFFVRESGREYTFERDASGRVVRIRLGGSGAPELVARRVD